MKNSRQIVRNPKTGSPMVIKSKKARDYADDFLAQVKRQKPLEGDIRIDATIYYASKLSDLDVAYLMDLMQKAGLIDNDRQVVEIHAYKEFDKKNPRVEFEIEEV